MKSGSGGCGGCDIQPFDAGTALEECGTGGLLKLVSLEEGRARWMQMDKLWDRIDGLISGYLAQ